MKTFILGLILILGSSFKPSGCLQLDLILIGDISYSVRGNEKFISDAFLSFVNRFELSENGVQIGMILFNSNTYLISPLSDNKDSLRYKALKIRTYVADTNTKLSISLEAALQEFKEHGYKRHRKFVIVVTDGDVDDTRLTIQAANNLNQSGIELCGILIDTPGSKPSFLRRICSDCYAESSYEELGKVLEDLGVCL